MSWGRKWPERQPRPKVRKLYEEEKAKILNSMKNSIISSPVLTVLNFRVKLARGRFYYEQAFSDTDDVAIMGRVTPLANPADEFLLEVDYGGSDWKKIKQGKIRAITNTVSGDTEGVFHGLGVLDKSIRAARKNKSDKLMIVEKENLTFSYAGSDTQCSVQEILFHYFGVPIDIIVEPRAWYAYRRTPHIKEIDENKNVVLVKFTAMSMSGGSFGGTCLYIKREDKWAAFTIRPNQSDTIQSAIMWLEKRKWVAW